MHKASFEPLPESARTARRFVADCLAGRADLDVTLAVLLTSELVTNAITHSRLTFDITVDLTATCVKVIVDDLSAVLPVVSQPDREDSTGRRLAIIGAIANRWGVEPTKGGKRAWFELCASQRGPVQFLGRFPEALHPGGGRID